MKLSEIKSIIKDFETSKLTELELEANNFKLKLSKNKAPIIKSNNESLNMAPTLINENTKETNKDDTFYIKSPLVGTFYESLRPGGKPIVKIGDTVKKDQVVCIVEAMKIMNEITSPYDGKISKINFNNGDVVGFEDVLFEVVK